jgi:preprotein translocase SecE subunit
MGVQIPPPLPGFWDSHGRAINGSARIESEMAEEVVTRRDHKGAWLQELTGELKGAWPRLRQYFADVMVETRKVTVPGKQEVYGTTVMVILTTFLFGIYFALCDRVFGYSVTKLLSYLRHHG